MSCGYVRRPIAERTPDDLRDVFRGDVRRRPLNATEHSTEDGVAPAGSDRSRVWDRQGFRLSFSRSEAVENAGCRDRRSEELQRQLTRFDEWDQTHGEVQPYDTIMIRHPVQRRRRNVLTLGFRRPPVREARQGALPGR